MSDQDFFFDDEEQSEPKAKEAAPKQTGKATAQGSASPSALSGIELTWTVTGLIAVVALLLGVIVGYAIPKSGNTVGTVQTGSAGQTAPQLTPEQMSSGQLPAGHPDIGGAAGAPGTTGAAGAATSAAPATKTP